MLVIRNFIRYDQYKTNSNIKQHRLPLHRERVKQLLAEEPGSVEMEGPGFSIGFLCLIFINNVLMLQMVRHIL